MTTRLLAHTISITGPDAIAFAHAQFSSHVRALEIGQWQFSAWLDARGRVRSLFHLARCSDDSLVLLLRGGSAEAVASALQRFVFRSRISIIAAAPCLLSRGPGSPLYSISCTPDLMVLGCGDHGLIVSPGGIEDQGWRLLQLRSGWPWLPDAALDRWLAPALSLQRLRAVVTDKGCYPGQEIVARLHFRGGHKHHLCRIVLSREMQAAEPSPIAGHDAGGLLEVVSAGAQVEALAVLDDDAIGKFMNGRLDVHDRNLVIWLREIWPE